MNNYLREIDEWKNTMRRKLTEKYSLAIPTDEAIEECRKHLPIVEIGAGRGYWASLIGGDIKCFDNQPQQTSYVPIYCPQDINWNNNFTLMMIWPPWNDPMAFELYQGNKVIYIGEWKGASATDSFFDELKINWKLIKQIEIPQYQDINDRMYVFER